MVDFDQGDPCHNIAIGKQVFLFILSMLPFLNKFSLLDGENLNLAEIFEISSTFHQNWIIYLLMRDQMIVASQNQINIWEFMG